MDAPLDRDDERFPSLSRSALRKLGQSLSPAIVLPAQWYDSPLRAHRTRGEVALMAAVLDAAISDFHLQFIRSGRRAQRLVTEAEEWMLSDETEWPFSFVNICTVLGLDPAYLRRGLRRWKQRQGKLAPLPRRQRSVWHRPVSLAA
ncbi:MAG TPA: hypothetical protein VNN62_03435 [Methylomirabilota bacterium]|jgi:hypothetical protein|nr:hypothetical protein [Methylomirabilota bacterium]